MVVFAAVAGFLLLRDGGDKRDAGVVAAADALARQRFDARCAGAGDAQHRRPVAVGAVGAAGAGGEGLAWLTPPLRLAGAALSDRYRLDDRYDRGCAFEECIARLLRVSFGAASDPDEAKRHAEGFLFVEALDPRDLALYRYRAGIGVARWRNGREIEQARVASGEEPGPAVYGFVVQREAVERTSARWGVRWEDISTADDRRDGIAGSALTVFDLSSDEMIGRRTGYTFAARPATATATKAASAASASCPELPAAGAPGSADRDFILALLR